MVSFRVLQIQVQMCYLLDQGKMSCNSGLTTLAIFQAQVRWLPLLFLDLPQCNTRFYCHLLPIIYSRNTGPGWDSHTNLDLYCVYVL